MSRVVQLPRAPGGFYSHNSFGTTRRRTRRHADDDYSWLEGLKLMFAAVCLIALVVAVSALVVGTAYVTLWFLSHQLGGIAQ